MSDTVKKIPKEAQEKILATYKEMQETWAKFYDLKESFMDLLHYTREGLGIPKDELWDMKPDASEFFKVENPPDIVLPPITDDEMEAVREMGVVDQTDHCSDPSDTTGA